jgi:RNA polymerase sigma-70 factor (TIGR02960 family)
MISILDRARAGDEQAFRELIAPHVREVHLHCYRMLGSLTDAEDLLQETLIAAWHGLDGFAGRSSLRTWLYRIATNRCLNAIRDAKRRVTTQPVPPFTPPDPSRRGELTWLQPYPDAWLDQLAVGPGTAAAYEAREDVELAFIAALQRLPPRQAAVVILADVLGFSTAEVSSMLDTGPTAVKGILQRGRAALAGHRTGAAHHQPIGGRGSAAEHNLASQFAAAFTSGDIDGVVALLTDDAWLAMPPAPHEYVGGEAIAGFLRSSAEWRKQRRLILEPTRANGQPAFGCYLSGPEDLGEWPAGLLVLTMTGNRIRVITRFLDTGLHRQFGLPDKTAVSRIR